MKSVPQQKNNKGLIAFLSILSLLLFITSAVLFWQQLKQGDVQAETSADKVDTSLVKERNPQEIKLQNAINALKGDTLLLTGSDFPQPIVISDTLLIPQDTLYIKTKGNIVFTADTGYSGCAILLSPASKYILMDSLVFANFSTAISGYNDALHLKNVRFNNCRIPMQSLFTFEDKKYVTGRILTNSFIKDSLPQSSNK